MTATARVWIKPISPAQPGSWFLMSGPAVVSGGAGGWVDLTRPKRRTTVEFDSVPPLVQTIPVLLDGLTGQMRRPTSIEPSARLLEQWALPTDSTGEPPILRISGPVEGAGRKWVITDLAWEGPIRNDRGRRVQQDVTVTLQEYITVTVVGSPAAAARRRRNG
ncbi:hypothetical protein [Nocardioides sp. GY 10127]|uniref:hypothetical protein n=1 Tax=Nocardioides sp. GY 10127 TaxID=2569762 RepID=UPI001458C2D0|nr:hypothetical protein [Nocardioides sp. GY 10127]